MRWSGSGAFALAAFSLFIHRPALPSEPTTRDDAYHYALYRDGSHDWNYVEWWYFNLVDPTRRWNLALTYSILDPDNLTSLGSAGLLAIAYTPNGSFQQSRFTPAERFHASSERADVLIESSGFIQVLDERTYRIGGTLLGEHAISWDLTYVREASPWLGHDRELVGLLPWETMSWLVYMPRARVTGVVVIDGEVHRVEDAHGYHDHNWGEWFLTNVIWNWGQYSEPGFDLELGDFRRRPVGVLAVEHRGERVVFSKDQYQVLHTRWSFDHETRQWYPVETWIRARNDGFALALSVRAVETLAILPPPHLPFLFVKPLVFEQTATYSGSLWESDERGAWRLGHVFHGLGFKEYATRALASP